MLRTFLATYTIVTALIRNVNYVDVVFDGFVNVVSQRVLNINVKLSRDGFALCEKIFDIRTKK